MHNPNVITIMRLSDGKIVGGNESDYDLFGWTHGEVILKPTEESAHMG